MSILLEFPLVLFSCCGGVQGQEGLTGIGEVIYLCLTGVLLVDDQRHNFFWCVPRDVEDVSDVIDCIEDRALIGILFVWWVDEMSIALGEYESWCCRK